MQLKLFVEWPVRDKNIPKGRLAFEGELSLHTHWIARAAVRACCCAWLLWRSMADELIRPLNEVLHVREIGVSSVVLAPGEFAVEQAVIHRRHFRCVIVVS